MLRGYLGYLMCCNEDEASEEDATLFFGVTRAYNAWESEIRHPASPGKRNVQWPRQAQLAWAHTIDLRSSRGA